jgi:transcriptional regulator with GAF, ATPase, and Fis domain
MTASARDLLPALIALSRWSGSAATAPDHALDEFSELLHPVLPHDRLVISHLDSDGHTFTIVGERAARGPILHREHYTSDVSPGERYIVQDWNLRQACAGEPMLVEDFDSDPRYAKRNAHEQAIAAAGFRSGMLVPIPGPGRVVGVLTLLSLEARRYGPGELDLVQVLAGLLAPAVLNAVRAERERRRRARLAALAGIGRTLGGSLNVREVFDRLAEAVRPALDFDNMGIALVTESGREVELFVEVTNKPNPVEPWRVGAADFSQAERIFAGESLLIHDTHAELDRRFAFDRLILDGGGRSALSAPLWLGERVGGALYFGKRRPYWFEPDDIEIAAAVAAQVVVALQHQRLVGEQGRTRRLTERLESLRSELGERFAFDALIGRAPALREQLTRAAKVAPTDTTVLLTGESGTGKELVARAVHQASLRADGPFVAINCAALPETLLESELFGHERGAFTGADRQRPGRFELAGGGTLFLDEVGELSPAVQAKLLRVLQEKQYERVGGTATLRADVRLIAATNRDLEAAVQHGTFREDLFYRLAVFAIALPALRERGDDVLRLAEHFVRTLGPRMSRGEIGLSRDAREALLAHAWPGNIRELSNAIERALIVSDGGLITAQQLGLSKIPRPSPDTLARGIPIHHARTASAGPAGSAGTVDRRAQPGTLWNGPPADRAGLASLATMEKQLVIDALAKARGNKSRAAALLGLTRSQLYTRLKRFRLDADE